MKNQNPFFRSKFSGELPSYLIPWVERFEKYEWYALAIYFISLLLCSTHLRGFSLLHVGIASSLAVFFFYATYLPVAVPEKKAVALFLQKLGGISASVSLLGLMFCALNWPGSKILLVGGMSSGIAFAVFQFLYKIPDPAFQQKLRMKTLRNILLALLCAFFYFTPPEIIRELGFSPPRSKEVPAIPTTDSTAVPKN